MPFPGHAHLVAVSDFAHRPNNNHRDEARLGTAATAAETRDPRARCSSERTRQLTPSQARREISDISEMATAASLRARKDQIVQQYKENLDLVRQIQKQAVQEVVNSLHPEVAGPRPDDEAGTGGDAASASADVDARAATTALLRDTGMPYRIKPFRQRHTNIRLTLDFTFRAVTVFRFCRRARFSPAAALKLLHATCQWRLTSGLLQLTPASISSLYLTKPLFFFHPDLYDRFGRPCAILNLKHVQRTEDGNLDALKDYVRFGWEVARRYLSDLSRSAASAQDPTLQMVVIVDLDQAGMSNLVLSLPPLTTCNVG